MPADSPEARELTRTRNEKLAQVHREWGVALREGIETYASLENLDVVLGDAQFPDIKVRQLINDQNYTRAGLAKDGRELTDGQVGNMLNDQIMMMTHHMNGYHEGHEGTIDAASAMAANPINKRTQRDTAASWQSPSRDAGTSSSTGPLAVSTDQYPPI